MFLRKFSSWNMLSSNLTSYLYSSRILGSCICYGIDSMHLKKNSTTDATTDLISNERNVPEMGNLTKTTDKKRLTANVVVPTLELERRQEIQSVVGIHFGPKSLYWTKINRNGDVLEWKNLDLFPAIDVGRKMHLPKIFALMDCVSESIPFSDIFVLEAPNQGMLTSVSSPVVIANAILRSQMIAILLTILNLRLENEDNSEEYYHKVFLLKPRIVSRFFKLLVGTERVSALALVDLILGIKDCSSSLSISEIMDESKTAGEGVQNVNASTKDPPPIFTPIRAPSSIIESYCALKPVEREAMGQSLLIAMAFYDLVVHKDPKVLATLQK